MSEKLAIVHRSYMESWGQSDKPPLPRQHITAALQRIDQLTETFAPENVIHIEEPPSTGFPTLKENVDAGDTVVLVGTRAAYCLRLARQVLEGIGATVELDSKGSLP